MQSSGLGERTYSGRAAEKRVMLGLIRLASDGYVSVDRIAEEMLVPRSLVSEILARYNLYDGDRLIGDLVINAAIRLLEETRGREEVCKSLDWRLYEELVARIFSMYGYDTLTGLRIKMGRRRCQIDVAAIGMRELFLAECKRWSRGMTDGIISNISSVLNRRVELLADLLSERLGSGCEETSIIPLIITIYGLPSATQVATHVPLRLLPNFLREYRYAMGCLPVKALRTARPLSLFIFRSHGMSFRRFYRQYL